jgi:spore germination cell wall hydrolase CwlJ-like protein
MVSVIAIELLCLATNVYFESRGEPEYGQIAVAEVTMNRVLDEKFPDTVCEVVHQGGEIRHRCQFSWYCDGLSDAIADKKAWNKAFDIALAYTQIKRSDLTKGSIYFHSSLADPWWSDEKEYITTIGNHIFYK